jgi:hypothetical protein
MKAFRKPDNLYMPEFSEAVLSMGSTKAMHLETWSDQLEHHEQYL